jgi:uncharacterized protein
MWNGGAPERLGPAALGMVLAAALLALTGVVSRSAVHTVDGVALPVATATAGSVSPHTTPPMQRIFLLADHPLLADGVRLPQTRCELPTFRRDRPSLHAYYSAFVACMDGGWQPVLRAHGIPHTAPALNTEEHPRTTGCGDPEEDPRLGEFTAMYCPADTTLYLPVGRLKAVDRGMPSSHLAVVAHEYGHHVQELSGLLQAATEEIGRAGDESAQARELNRRIELQANCFAGLFLAAAAGSGSIGRDLASQAVAEFRNGALPQTHGSRVNQAAWARKGYNQRTTAACNTFAAPPREVS